MSEHHPCEIPPTRRLQGGRAEGVGGHFAVDDYAVHCLLCGRWPPLKHIIDSRDLTSALTGRAVPPKYSYLPTTFLAPRACGPVQRLVRDRLATPRDHHPCEISQTPALHCGSAEGEGGHFSVNDYAVHCLLCGRWPPLKHIIDSRDLTSELTGRAVPPE